MKNKPQISLKHVADKAGVSRMTASLALRDDGRLPESTRNRIQVIAEELGYKPNPRMSKIRAEAARCGHEIADEKIAFVTSYQEQDEWMNRAHTLECFKGAKEQAKRFGFTIESVWLGNPAFKKKDISRVLWSRGIEGLLVAPPGDLGWVGATRTLPLDWTLFSVVALDDVMDEPELHVARHDHYDGMLHLLQSMEALGYRRIGMFITNYVDNRTRFRWHAAYLLWRQMRGLDADLPILIYDEPDPDAIRTWITDYGIDAIATVGKSDYEAILAAGFRIPEDIGLALLDKPITREEVDFSGIYQHARQVGMAAVDTLLGLLRNGSKGVPEVASQRICRGCWVPGETVRKIGEPLVTDWRPTLRTTI